MGTEYSDPFKCFTVIFQPLAKIIQVHFPPYISVDTAPHIDRETENCGYFCKCIEQKLKYVYLFLFFFFNLNSFFLFNHF